MAFARSVLAVARPSVTRVAASKVQWTAARSMATGTVKWFNVNKGFGFVTLDEPDGHDDVFVHQTAIQSGGFRFLREGERVEFDMVDTDRGIQAANVTGVGGAPLDRSRMDYGDNE